ncbi:hypothetical protein F5Y14DRAFT_432925 [Nemania sp. NC0429]|nr:hypothetical protein F5Y14DRAFT_432925 [Nemania sp. NC0429]
MSKFNLVSKSSSSDKACTPGDRKCHASLSYVLFCNDSNQWVTYAGCQDGTFCHRLHMICVNEVQDPATVFAAAPALDVKATAPETCKEGDRRCSLLFNRVDRCNDGHDWVTYHNCRKSELCDDTTLECLPRISYRPKGSMSQGPTMSSHNGTTPK